MVELSQTSGTGGEQAVLRIRQADVDEIALGVGTTTTTTEFNTVIMADGSIGIGTDSPNEKLEVNGTAGGLLFDVGGNMPTVNTTSGNVTITSIGGSVIIRLG